MKHTLDLIAALAQMIIGILILCHHASIYTLAWFYAIVGTIGVLFVIIGGLVLLHRESE
jgi:hypothetical protein